MDLLQFHFAKEGCGKTTYILKASFNEKVHNRVFNIPVVNILERGHL